MLQAFVLLKPQQPARTESGMRSFFESIQNAVFSQPTIFCSNTDPTPRQYSIDAVIEAALNPRCKFVVLRADTEKFWQCTFLLPDVQGTGAMHFDLQRANNPRRISATSLVNMFKTLYESLSPKLVRVGDSEAREKLKSRHGLVRMPGIGRVEWLQIVSPEIYGDIYNPSDLAAAPAYKPEIWDDGAFFLRVYEDPNDWESEDNESLANFIPGFLAGIAKIKDGEKENKIIHEIERLCVRAEKTAEKAYTVLDKEGAAAPVPVAAPAQAVAAPAPAAPAPVAAKPVSDADAEMRKVIFTRLKEEYKVSEENIVRAAVEGKCTLFKVKLDNNKPDMYVSFQDDERKVLVLNVLEDLSRFLKINGCAVKDESIEKMAHLIGTYYHPENKFLKSLDELPENVRNDRRVPEYREKYKYGEIKHLEGDNREVIFLIYQPECEGIESISVTQYEEWPVSLESKVLCTDMENVKEAPRAAEPVKPAEAPEAEGPKPDNVPVSAKETAKAPAKTGGADKAKIIIAIIFLIVILGLAFTLFWGGMI